MGRRRLSGGGNKLNVHRQSSSDMQTITSMPPKQFKMRQSFSVVDEYEGHKYGEGEIEDSEGA
jgi:hypothetical protein